MSDFKRDIDERLSPLTVSPALRQRILDATARLDAVKPAAAKHRKPSRALLTAAAAVLVLVCGVSGFAAAFPSFEAFLERMGQDLRDTLQPMEQVSVANGIRMEVVAAASDGQSAALYLTLRDEEGDRIDENTQLCFSEIVGETPHIFSMDRPVDFDTETRTATYRFDGESMEPLLGSELTLRVTGLLTGETYHEEVDLGYTVADVMAMNSRPETSLPEPLVTSYGIMPDYGKGYAVSTAMEQAIDNNTMPVLTENNPGLETGLPWLNLSAAGVVDGWLHLRTEPVGETGKYNTVNVGLRYPPQAVAGQQKPAEEPAEQAEKTPAPDSAQPVSGVAESAAESHPEAAVEAAMAAGAPEAAAPAQNQPVEQELMQAPTTAEDEAAMAGGLEEGPPQLAQAQLSLGVPEEIGWQQYYPATETVLELPEGVPAEDVHLTASGTTYEHYVDGEWTASFRLDEAADKLAFDCDIELGGWRIYRVEVSPIGVTAFCDGKMSETSESLAMEVRMKDGTLAQSSSSSGSGNADGDIHMRATFDRPIDLSQVDSVELNGVSYTPVPVEG